MPEVTKAIRFSSEDWDLIAKFLKENPFFDFSTLARMAIQEFVLHPKLVIKAVSVDHVSKVDRNIHQNEILGGPNG